MRPASPTASRFTRHGRLRLLDTRRRARARRRCCERWAAGNLPPARALLGGRGGVGAFQLRPDLGRRAAPVSARRPDGARQPRALLRHLAARPFRELRASEALRAAGVPTPEVLGAAVRWDAPGVYTRRPRHPRGAGARSTSGTISRGARPRERGAGLRRRRGGRPAACTTPAPIHPDLNLQNYLVRRTAVRHSRPGSSTSTASASTASPRPPAAPPSSASAGRSASSIRSRR